MNLLSESGIQLLECRVKAEGWLPEPENMKVDFAEEAENQEKAVKKIKAKIDRYLDKHKIEEFVFENHGK